MYVELVILFLKVAGILLEGQRSNSDARPGRKAQLGAKG